MMNHSPLKASLWGTGLGGLFVSCVILHHGWQDRRAHSALPDQKWTDGLAWFPALHGVWVGGMIGGAIGFALWVVLTRQPVHWVFTAFAGGVLAIVLCTLFFIPYNAWNAPRGAGGLGATMYAVGMGRLYFFVLVPGSAVLGVLSGLLLGLAKTRQR